ncbi:recombinase family protein [Candidatus Bipolaricaulota bacterium]|nr:recombinase family protein [Candidatus Bipolaricaulota bacterium]
MRAAKSAQASRQVVLPPRCPQEAHCRRYERVFEIYAHQDISLSQLVGVAREMGLKSRRGHGPVKATLHRILQHPIYYGAIRWEGILYTSNHEPLISKELFDRVQERLRGGSSPLTKRSFPYRGILTCGYCGCKITASLAKKRYVFYHCTHGRGKCEQPYIREGALSDLLLPVVEGVHISEDLAKALLDRMYERHKDEIERREREVGGIAEGRAQASC